MTQKITPEDIERKKDNLDLVPCIKFVDRHRQLFEDGLKRIYAGFQSGRPEPTWLESIKFTCLEDMIEPQLNQTEIRTILACLPQSMIQLSMLQTITYNLPGYKRVVPVPVFDEDGNFVSAELVPIDEFPRPGDHPTRLLVGHSDGKEIRLTPIPKCISTRENAVWYYQLHVFLHEFFHTIKYLRRDSEKRSKIILEVDGKVFTFQEWWDNFEELILSGREPIGVSRYAATYIDQLTVSAKKDKPDGFTRDLAEQMAETFVAYILNIISNNEDWTDFRKESFGNEKQAELFGRGLAQAANEKWILMDQLVRATVISLDDTEGNS